MEVKCPKCGKVNPEGASSCEGCGADLKEETVALTPENFASKGEIVISVEAEKKKLIIIFPESVTETFELKDGIYRIGRSEDSEIFLNDLTVSRTHAEMTVRGSEVTIRDLGSLNGTFVNGKLVESPTSLKDGDVIQIGRFKLLFKSHGVVEDD